MLDGVWIEEEDAVDVDLNVSMRETQRIRISHEKVCGGLGRSNDEHPRLDMPAGRWKVKRKDFRLDSTKDLQRAPSSVYRLEN